MTIKIDLKGSYKLQDQLKILSKSFPEEVRAMILEVAFVDVLTFAIENESGAHIPVDTGRLRSSFHVKYLKKPNPETAISKRKIDSLQIPEQQTNYHYSAKENNSEEAQTITYDGSLSEIVDIDTIVVGSNVEYAKKINREGGGGINSRSKLPKGTGQGFFDKAVANGKINLIKETRNLAKRLEKIAEKAREKAKGGEN